MNLRLVWHNSSPASASPYRLVDEQGRELAWVNYFLDAQKLRQLSLRSLRAYAYDLLHLARWLQDTRHSLAKLNQSLLLDYVRCQLDHHPKPTPQTINHRLGVLRRLYRFHYGREIPAGKSHFQHTYRTHPAARLRQVAPQGRHGSPTAATPTRGRASLARPGGVFLERLSHLP